MPTVTLKADERLYKQITLMANELHLSKSELIRRAVNAYKENLERNKLKIMMQEASLKVRDHDKEMIDELDVLVFDGLSGN